MHQPNHPSIPTTITTMNAHITWIAFSYTKVTMAALSIFVLTMGLKGY